LKWITEIVVYAHLTEVSYMKIHQKIRDKKTCLQYSPMTFSKVTFRCLKTEESENGSTKFRVCIRVIKSRRMRWARHVAYTVEVRNAQKH